MRFRLTEKIIIGALCIALVGVSFAGCGQKQEPQKSIKIGVTLYNQYDVFLSSMMVAFNDRVSEKSTEEGININVETYNASGNQLTQNSQVEQMINDGCDVICVNLVDRTDPGNIIAMAKENDVPIIFFNREMVEEDLEQWDKLYYIGAKTAQAGELQAEIIVDYVTKHPECDTNEDGIIQYLMVEGEPGHQDSILRSQNVVSGLEDNLAIEKVDYIQANWDRDLAKTKMEQIYQENPHIELVISNNDAMALGVIDVYEKYEVPVKDRPIIVGVDGVDEALKAIEGGTLMGTVYNEKENQAKNMLDLSLILAKGEDPHMKDFEKYTRSSYVAITKENVKNFE